MIETMQEYMCCRYCKKGAYIPIERKTICSINGIVARDFTCPKFEFDPFRLQVRRARNMDFSKYEKEDYSIE